jgi:uncharacterized protein YbgA (DUF1722 family)/uncharacterized protein YbbK (DUF523 family)
VGEGIIKPKIGISRCLLGENVRYNGGHKLDHYIKETLGEFVEFIPICPEVEAGLGVPRESLELNEVESDIRLIGKNSREDYTDKIDSWLDRKIPEIDSWDLCGFILKSKSPSCGIYRTRLYRESKPPSLNSRGLFAKRLIESYPTHLVEEEGRLHDPIIRDNFIERVFINLRWREFVKEPSVSKLMKFHQDLKYTLMCHSPWLQKELGKVVAAATYGNLDYDIDNYYKKLNSCISEYSSKKSHRNVLDHIMGYFKKDLSGDEKAELKEIIANYSRGLVPLIVPITLINHYVRKYNQDYLKTQFYLNPHPLELMLRNHI